MRFRAKTARFQPQIGLGIQVDGAYSVARSLPPRLGEHTDAIMRELHGQEKPAVTEID